MADDTPSRSRRDQLRINVNEEHEVRYWTKELDCTETQLREAVRSVGVMAADVRRVMGKKK